MGDLFGEDTGLAQPNNLCRCLDLLVAHKPALFTFLRERWKNLFQADLEALLYDLTSAYFECDPPESGKRKFGYRRDKRCDCVQVVVALIVTPDGLPLVYEVMDGNTSDKTTLRAFLTKIETQYGSAKRTWAMDRGIPTGEVLAGRCHDKSNGAARSLGSSIPVRRRSRPATSERLLLDSAESAAGYEVALKVEVVVDGCVNRREALS
jgi:hypothetical protein